MVLFARVAGLGQEEEAEHFTADSLWSQRTSPCGCAGPGAGRGLRERCTPSAGSSQGPVCPACRCHLQDRVSPGAPVPDVHPAASGDPDRRDDGCAVTRLHLQAGLSYFERESSPALVLVAPGGGRTGGRTGRDQGGSLNPSVLMSLGHRWDPTPAGEPCSWEDQERRTSKHHQVSVPGRPRWALKCLDS